MNDFSQYESRIKELIHDACNKSRFKEAMIYADIADVLSRTSPIPDGTKIQLSGTYSHKLIKKAFSVLGFETNKKPSTEITIRRRI